MCIHQVFTQISPINSFIVLSKPEIVIFLYLYIISVILLECKLYYEEEIYLSNLLIYQTFYSGAWHMYKVLKKYLWDECLQSPLKPTYSAVVFFVVFIRPVWELLPILLLLVTEFPASEQHLGPLICRLLLWWRRFSPKRTSSPLSQVEVRAALVPSITPRVQPCLLPVPFWLSSDYFILFKVKYIWK